METVYQLILFPAEVAFRFEDEPRQMEAALAVTEVGTEGNAETATVAVAVLVQPLPLVKLYVMTDVPADTPVTNPPEEFTVATEGVALLQVPPVVVLFNVEVEF